ncbi:MAG: mechanosensitive ion channel [Elusimicrobia bacterium]|nr:mechanosensitive ion channel [Elusimicrobiota bacterium]
MDRFVEIFNRLVADSAKQVSDFVLGFGPKIVFAVLILLLGWLLAMLAKKIVAKLLKAIGFNVFSEKIGVQKFMEKGGIVKPPSLIAAVIVYWIVIFNTLMLVSEVLNIETPARFFNDLLSYMPSLGVVFIIIILGVITAKFASKFTTKATKLAGLPFSKFIGSMAGYIFVGLSILLSFEYLNISKSVSIQFSIIILGMIPLTIALFLIIGGKDTVSSILASRYVKNELSPGDMIEIENISGEVVSVGLISTKISHNNYHILIPNYRFLTEILKKTEAE